MAEYNIYTELIKGETVLASIIMNNIHKTEYFKNLPNTVGSKPKETIEVKLTLNGEQLDIRGFFEMVDEQWEDIVKKTATQMVKEQTSEKLDDLIGKLQTMQEMVECAAETINWDTNFTKEK